MKQKQLKTCMCTYLHLVEVIWREMRPAKGELRAVKRVSAAPGGFVPSGFVPGQQQSSAGLTATALLPPSGTRPSPVPGLEA